MVQKIEQTPIIFKTAQKIRDCGERILLGLDEPKWFGGRFFQNQVVKPWRSFVAGYDLTGKAFFKYVIFYFFFYWLFWQCMKPLREVLVARNEVFGLDVMMGMVLLLPFLFVLYATPLYYSYLSISEQMLARFSQKIEEIMQGQNPQNILLIKENLDEMASVARQWIKVPKFLIWALWGLWTFIFTRNPYFPFNLVDPETRMMNITREDIGMWIFLIFFSEVFVGLSAIQDKFALFIRLAIREYQSKHLTAGSDHNKTSLASNQNDFEKLTSKFVGNK